MVKANWSGGYPSLCCGQWSLEVDGCDVTDKIPEELRVVNMNTYGTYSEWHFDDNWMEVFEDYFDGLKCDDWIATNKEWLNKISQDLDIQKEIFEAIQQEDFRPGSCGGCI